MSNINFWLDQEKKLVNPDLFSEVAKEWAERIKNEGLENKNKNKITQIRKFYDEVIFFYDQVKTADEENFQRLLPFSKMIRAKVYYAKGRDLITPAFQEFIEKCLDEVKTKEDFKVFMNFFEAFMGFYRYFEETKKSKTFRDQKRENQPRR